MAQRGPRGRALRPAKPGTIPFERQTHVIEQVELRWRRRAMLLSAERPGEGEATLFCSSFVAQVGRSDALTLRQAQGERVGGFIIRVRPERCSSRHTLRSW